MSKKTPATPDDKLLTTHEVAKLVQADASTISKWIDKGILNGFHTPGGHRRVRAGDLRQLAREVGMFLPKEF